MVEYFFSPARVSAFWFKSLWMKINQPYDLLLKKLWFVNKLRVGLQIFWSGGPNFDSASNCFVLGGTGISPYTRKISVEIMK
jgi:hypothetical protein